MKALKKSPKALILMVLVVLNGGLKAAMLELYIKDFIAELASPDVIPLVKSVELFNRAA